MIFNYSYILHLKIFNIISEIIGTCMKIGNINLVGQVFELKRSWQWKNQGEVHYVEKKWKPINLNFKLAVVVNIKAGCQ